MTSGSLWWLCTCRSCWACSWASPENWPGSTHSSTCGDMCQALHVEACWDMSSPCGSCPAPPEHPPLQRWTLCWPWQSLEPSCCPGFCILQCLHRSRGFENPFYSKQMKCITNMFNVLLYHLKNLSILVRTPSYWHSSWLLRIQSLILSDLSLPLQYKFYLKITSNLDTNYSLGSKVMFRFLHLIYFPVVGVPWYESWQGVPHLRLKNCSIYITMY